MKTKCTKKCDAGENCFFFCSLRRRPHVFGENGHRKRTFSKTLASRLRVDGRTDGIRGFRVRCHTSYTTSITHVLWGCYRYFHHFSVFMWTGENDSNTQSVDAYFFFFLENGGKKSPFSNISGYVWTQPVITRALNILITTNLMSYLF